MRLLRLDKDGEPCLTVDFREADIPPYAILSHRWGRDEDEITFKELRKGQGKSKPGYAKIKACGEQARKDGIEHFWVDTCCIDKRSSAELSQAINSMYRWYQKSKVCYVYLTDVPDVPDWLSDFENSEWFERGWTLQELLAPKHQEFFNAEWKPLGRKSKLLGTLEAVTRIPRRVLLDPEVQLNNVPIAVRMSWASRRVTSVIEDISYCLMGIFDVNMPLLYGEGPRAFRRLQEHIMARSDDDSIFVWERQPVTIAEFERPSMIVTEGYLAPDICRFSGWHTLSLPSETLPYRADHFVGPRTSFMVTNKGLSIDTEHYRLDPYSSVIILGDSHAYLSSSMLFLLLILQKDDGTYSCLDVFKATQSNLSFLSSSNRTPRERLYLRDSTFHILDLGQVLSRPGTSSQGVPSIRAFLRACGINLSQ